MRIRKCASRLLGSAYSSAPPVPAPRFGLPLPLLPPPPYPGAGPEYRAGGADFAAATASGEPCELSRSPWDLIGELDLSDPQEEELVGKYFVHVACRASWLFPTSMPVAAVKKEEELTMVAVHEDSTQPRHEIAKKPLANKTVVKEEKKEKEKEKEKEKDREPKKKDREPKKKAKVKKEEELTMVAVHEDSTQPRHEIAKKPQAKKTVVKEKQKEEKEKEKEKEDREPKKKAKVKKEESVGEVAGREAAQVWTCKKNDGKRWHCQQQVSRPNTLCDYHFEQKRSYYNPVSESLLAAAPVVGSSASAASKPSHSSKPRRKKSGDAGEGFYYYAGFGPFRTKRHCRSSSSMHESVPGKQEDEEAPPEDHAAPTAGQAQVDDSDHQAAARDDDPSCNDIAGIAGGDEESSDDNGDYTHGCNGNDHGEPRASINSGSKRKTQWKKRWRKPVKARSLKSLM